MFAYDLAKELGIWDVRGMLQKMSWSQFVEWSAYHQRNPFGEARADMRAGIVASVIANVNRDPKKKPQPYKADDFMPKYGASARKASGPREPMMAEGWSSFKSMALAVYGSGKKQQADQEGD